MIKNLTKRTFLPLLFLLLILQGILLFPSCGKPELIPTYIHIDSIALNTNPGQDGSNSHAIADAWVYVDNNLVGAFELPATIPVPYSGSHLLQIFPGIKENGTSAERMAYPFYTLWTTTMNMVKGTKTTVKPVSAYTSFSHPFDWREDFELPGISLTDNIGTDTTIIQDTVRPFEGHASGSVYLDGKPGKAIGSFHSHFQCQSSVQFARPESGTEVYLEVNYRCNAPFTMGLVNPSNSQFIQYLTLNATNYWKKEYIRLTDLMTGLPVGGNYIVYFAMDRDPLFAGTAEMHIDNIKLIH
jgi:hypothetical protein